MEVEPDLGLPAGQRAAARDLVQALLDQLATYGAGTVAGLYASVTPDQVERRGVRSNGDSFTTLTLGQYHLHDVVHHLHDIGCDVGGLTTGRP